MMLIRFKSIKIENFKSIELLETNFGNNNTFIYGANETGKTSFADAISWCLTGKNSMGDSQFEFVPVGKNDVSPSVTLCIDISGKVKGSADYVILQRVYQAKQNKKKEFTGEYQTICFVNRLKVGVREFDKWVETHICNPEIFRLIHDIRYFTENIATKGNERKWEAQRRLLFSISGIKTDIDFVRSKKKFSLILAGMERYDNANQYLAFLKSEEKRLNEEIRYHNARIEMMKSMLGEKENNDKNIDADIKRLTMEKARIETEIEQAKNRVENERAKRIKSAKEEFNNKIEEFKKSQTEYSKKAAELNFKRERLIKESMELHCSLVSFQFDLKKAKEAYGNISVQCPTCGQYIPQEIVEDEKEKLRKQIEIIQGAVDSISEKEREVKEELELVEGEISKLTAPIYTEELRMLQDKVYQEENSGVNIAPGTNQRMQQIKDKISELTAKKVKNSQNEKLKNDIAELELAIKDKLQQKADNSRLMDVVHDFIDAKCKYAEKKVNSLFDGIEFKMFRQNKTNDEAKECCDIYWNGVPYDSLSYSTKFVVSMKIALAFQEYYKVSMPIVVDNSESIDFGFKVPVQSIMLIKRDECCPECGNFVGRKQKDGMWICRKCENRFKKSLAIEVE